MVMSKLLWLLTSVCGLSTVFWWDILYGENFNETREGRILRVFLLTKLGQITIHQITPCYPKGRCSASLSCSYIIVPLRATLYYTIFLLPPGNVAASRLAQNFPSTLWYKINHKFLSFTFHISSLSLTTETHHISVCSFYVT